MKEKLSSLKNKTFNKLGEIGQGVKSVEWKLHAKNIITKIENYDYSKIKSFFEFSFSEIKKGMESLKGYANKYYDKEDVLDFMKNFDEKVSSKFWELKSIVKTRNNRLDEGDFFVDDYNIVEEREIQLNFFEEEVKKMNFNEDRIELKNYKNKISEEGFNQLNNAEGLFDILLENSNCINDYSPIYIMYAKFLEIELANKFTVKRTSLGALIKEAEKNNNWQDFVYIFNHLEIREKRNCAAHDSEVSISFADVNDIREFILSKVVTNLLVSF